MAISEGLRKKLKRITWDSLNDAEKEWFYRRERRGGPLRVKSVEDIDEECLCSYKAAQFILDMIASRGWETWCDEGTRLLNAANFDRYWMVRPFSEQAFAILVDSNYLRPARQIRKYIPGDELMKRIPELDTI
jgi:hypothetical protein